MANAHEIERQSVLSRLRGAVHPLKLKLAGPLARAGIHPNTVTLTAIPFSLGAFALAATGHPLWGFALALAAALADLLDGSVAELQQRQTPQGNFLEAVVDRLVDGFLLAGLAPRYPILCACALTVSFSVSYVKARLGLVLLCDNRDWPGCGDRPDRVVVLLLAYLGEGLKAGMGEQILWILLGLSLIGLGQRLRHAWERIDQGQHNGTLLPYLQPPPEPSRREG